jgi:general secretion pathway protein M
MKAWWATLANRERLLVVLAGGTVLIALLYLMVWEPFAQERSALASRVQAHQKDLAWMEQAAAELQGLRATTRTHTVQGRQRSLLAVIDASAKQTGLRKVIQRMEPVGQEGVKLWVENADFDRLIGWLGDLKQRFGIRVTRASFDRKDTPGRVDARLSLQRS